MAFSTLWREPTATLPETECRLMVQAAAVGPGGAVLLPARERAPLWKALPSAGIGSWSVENRGAIISAPDTVTCGGPLPSDPVSVPHAVRVVLEAPEGHGRFGRDRMHHWRIAYGSAKEVDSHLRLLAQAGAIDKAQADAVLALFDRVRAMTWRLLDPKG